MDAGLMIRWGKVVPGREEQALALFDETVKFYGELLKSRKLTYFEPFLFSTADIGEEQGFFLIKGPIAEIFKLYESDEFKRLNTKGGVLLEHLTFKFMYVGEDVPLALERYRKSLVELQV